MELVGWEGEKREGCVEDEVVKYAVNLDDKQSGLRLSDNW